VILYNVPSRTGCNMLPDTVARLAEHEKICGVKEASGNIAQVVEILAKCGDKIDLYSGEDALTVPMMSMGGVGCISVLSNVMPKESAQLANKFFAGDLAGAAQLQKDVLGLVNALFCEVNPIPVKAACAAMGFCENYLRLPLTPMEEDHRQNLLRLMRKAGLNV
jgi:4-hydroxy-tetrahydrodipicolinate synthase